MRENKKGVLLIGILIVVIVVAIGIFLWMNINNEEKSDNTYENNLSLNYENIEQVAEQEKSSTYDLFNKKITYNFGNGAAYEIDVSQIINDYDEIVIRNNHLLLYRGEGGISISKNETMFENLPPNEILTSGESKNYTIIYEDESTKLYEVTNRFSYNTPNGGDHNESISYELYRKEDICTLEITGSDKDEVLKISSLIILSNEQKTLEEQFYGITVLDGRIIDTSKITIDEIYNVDAFLDIGINMDDGMINVRFLSEEDQTYLPRIKRIDNWELVAKKNDYEIYHENSSGVESDALKIVKNGEEYFIDLSARRVL